MGRQQEVKCIVQNIWEIFGKMTVRPKRNTEKSGVCKIRSLVYVSSCSRRFHPSAWLVTYLEMECGLGETGAKLRRLESNREP